MFRTTSENLISLSERKASIPVCKPSLLYVSLKIVITFSTHKICLARNRVHSVKMQPGRKLSSYLLNCQLRKTKTVTASFHLHNQEGNRTLKVNINGKALSCPQTKYLRCY